MSAPRLEGVLETCLYHDAAERERTEAFYAEVLGLAETARWPDGVAFRLGAGVVLLFDRDKLAAGDGPLKDHGTAGPGHACFVVDASAPTRRGGSASPRPGSRSRTSRNGPAGGSFYFKDPAGNLLEIADGDLWG